MSSGTQTKSKPVANSETKRELTAEEKEWATVVITNLAANLNVFDELRGIMYHLSHEGGASALAMRSANKLKMLFDLMTSPVIKSRVSDLARLMVSVGFIAVNLVRLRDNPADHEAAHDLQNAVQLIQQTEIYMAAAAPAKPPHSHFVNAHGNGAGHAIPNMSHNELLALMASLSNSAPCAKPTADDDDDASDGADAPDAEANGV